MDNVFGGGGFDRSPRMDDDNNNEGGCASGGDGWLMMYTRRKITKMIRDEDRGDAGGSLDESGRGNYDDVGLS